MPYICACHSRRSLPFQYPVHESWKACTAMPSPAGPSAAVAGRSMEPRTWTEHFMRAAACAQPCVPPAQKLVSAGSQQFVRRVVETSGVGSITGVPQGAHREP